MANYLLKDQPFVFCGLGTLTYNVLADGNYNAAVQLSENPPSGLSVLVKNNGSTIFTAPTITPTQIAQQFRVAFQAVANDVITVVLASSEQIDNNLNTVKSTIYVGGGQ